MKKIYLTKERQEKLNEYEKEHGKISYRTLLECMGIDCILCNNIPNIDESIFDNVETGTLYEETEDGDIIYNDIYQYYIINANEWDIEYIRKYYNDELIIAYSEKLENYILCVDHFGTSWDYVLTDITYTNNYEEWEQYKKGKDNEEGANNEE